MKQLSRQQVVTFVLTTMVSNLSCE